MSSFVDLSKSITLTSAETVTGLCQPFFKLTGTNFFDFLRVYEDQGHISLSTAAEWSKVYYESGFFEGRRHEYYNKNDISTCSLSDLESPTPKDLARIKIKNHFF